jgi:hypothetical protein
LDDLIVGAKYANPNGHDSGKSYVIFGKTDTNAIDLAKLGSDIAGVNENTICA